MRTLVLLALTLLGCHADATPPSGVLVLTDASLPGGGSVALALEDGRILAAVPDDATRVDLGGYWVAPGFIDAHVHIVYSPKRDELVPGGIVGAVDWAAPLDRMQAEGPTVVFAGPILTAPGGYPTRSWGADGYGLEVEDAEAATAAVDQVHAAGAGVVKVTVGGGGPQLDRVRLEAIVARAHTLGLPVGAHALDDASARLAGEVGADVLVHAPRGTLSEETVALWADRALIATVSAFGGETATRQLHEAGTTILYGTDFGNTIRARISDAELRGLLRSGLSGAEILAAGTSLPAARFGFEDLGSLEPGKEASLLVLDADPHVDPLTLARPVAVLHRGIVVAGALPEPSDAGRP